MGHVAIYKCFRCGNEFESCGGGGFYFIEYRCITCDAIKAVTRKARGYCFPAEKEIGVCERCGGELRNDINPMCSKCKSRDVREKEVKVWYD